MKSLDKLTDKLANYIVMLDTSESDKTNQSNINIPKGKYITSIGYAEKIYSTF